LRKDTSDVAALTDAGSPFHALHVMSNATDILSNHPTKNKETNKARHKL